MSIYKAYKYRLYPNREDRVLLAKHFGCVRFIYNYALDLKVKAYQQGEKLTCTDIEYRLPALKKTEGFTWLEEVNSQSLQKSLKNLDNAFQRFFREKKGFPKFKSRKSAKQTFQVPQGIKVSFEAGRLSLPKFRQGIKCVFHRHFTGTVKMVTISKTATQKYYASILVEVESQAKTKPGIQPATTVGVDVGIKSFAVCSNGKVFENPKYLKQSLKRLKCLQRRLSKKQKGSTRREKAKLRLALLYEYVTNQRRDYHHKVSFYLTHSVGVDTICIEDLNIQGMLQNHCLASSISDAAWSMLFEFLGYKTEWEGKNLITIGRFDASSKLCHVCGTINKDLTLSQREWVCGSCNTVLDRDLNAAMNIKTFGLARYATGPERPVGLGEMPSLEGSMNREANRL